MSNTNSVSISGPNSYAIVKDWCERFGIDVKIVYSAYKNTTLVKGEAAPSVGRAFGDSGWLVRTVTSDAENVTDAERIYGWHYEHSVASGISAYDAAILAGSYVERHVR